MTGALAVPTGGSASSHCAGDAVSAFRRAAPADAPCAPGSTPATNSVALAAEVATWLGAAGDVSTPAAVAGGLPVTGAGDSSEVVATTSAASALEPAALDESPLPPQALIESAVTHGIAQRTAWAPHLDTDSAFIV